MNFISLTKSGGQELIVNPLMIVCLETSLASGFKSVVYMMGYNSCMVVESIDEIKKKIAEADRFTLVNYDK
jgi:uncharacterized protein YlzI (FlbEa/FlbD family)